MCRKTSCAAKQGVLCAKPTANWGHAVSCRSRAQVPLSPLRAGRPLRWILDPAPIVRRLRIGLQLCRPGRRSRFLRASLRVRAQPHLCRLVRNRRKPASLGARHRHASHSDCLVSLAAAPDQGMALRQPIPPQRARGPTRTLKHCRADAPQSAPLTSLADLRPPHPPRANRPAGCNRPARIICAAAQAPAKTYARPPNLSDTSPAARAKGRRAGPSATRLEGFGCVFFAGVTVREKAVDRDGAARPSAQMFGARKEPTTVPRRASSPMEPVGRRQQGRGSEA